MIYDYRCHHCGWWNEVIKPATRFEDREACWKCGNRMKVQLGVPKVSVGTFKEGFNHALGRTFTNARQLKDHLAKVKGETGRELVEIGNERTFPKRRKQEYGLTPEMVQELKKVIGK